MSRRTNRAILTTIIVVACDAGGFKTHQQGTDAVWDYVVSKDQITDAVTTSIMKVDDSPRGSPGAMMVWRCQAGRLEAYVATDSYYGGNSDDEVEVTYRIDSLTAVGPQSWGQATDNHGAFVPRSSLGRFAGHLRSGGKVILRMTDPLDRKSETFTFDLRGFDSAYARLPCVKRSPRGSARDSVPWSQQSRERVED